MLDSLLLAVEVEEITKGNRKERTVLNYDVQKLHVFALFQNTVNCSYFIWTFWPHTGNVEFPDFRSELGDNTEIITKPTE